MSKLLEKIRAEFTGERKPLINRMSPLDIVTENYVEELRSPVEAIGFNVSVSFAMRGFVRSPEELTFIRKKFEEELRNEIYGEFREELLSIYLAVQEQDDRSAVERIKRLMEKIQ